MKNLLKNELIKLKAQTSFKVILIIALVISLIAPLFVILVSTIDYTSFYDPVSMYESAADENTIWGEYCQANIDAYKYFDDNNISRNGWEYNLYYQAFSREFLAVRGLELLKERNYNAEDIVSYFYEINDYFNGNFFYIEDKNGYHFNYNYSVTAVEEAYTKAKADLEETIKSIKEFDIDAYYDDIINNYQEMLDSSRENLKQLMTAKANENELEKASIEFSITQVNGEIEKYSSLVEAAKRLKAAKADYSDWKVKAELSLRSDLFNERNSHYTVDEIVFNSEESYKINYNSYYNYTGLFADTRDYFEACLKLLDNSVENNISPDFEGVSGKTLMQSSMNTSIMMFSLFMIIAAAMSVAKEHGDGTIRLLLARPKKRSKILLSKYLSILVVGFFNYLMCFVYLVLIFTIYDAQSIWGMSNHLLFGAVITLPTIVMLLLQYLMLTVGAVFLMSIAFMFSVITKRSGLALLFPMLILAVTSTISTICRVVMLLSNNVTLIRFVKYSIFSYFDLSQYLTTPLEMISRNESIFTIMNISFTNLYPVWLGIIQLLFVTAVFVFISFKTFKKQDIKG